MSFMNGALAPHETGVIYLIARGEIEFELTSSVGNNICTSYIENIIMQFKEIVIILLLLGIRGIK